MTSRQFLLTLSLAAATIPAALSQTTATHTRKFQPVGLGATETAQINVLNSASASSSGTAASCTGSISFLSSTGTTIGAATTFTVTSGQIFSVKLPFASSGGSGVRTIIIGEVSVTPVSGTPCSLSATLETWDTATGATHIELTGGDLTFGR
jgi:hypothetical protein